MFTDIVMIDYTRPLAERAAARKHVGPYRWNPQRREPHTSHPGRAFYQGHGLYMDPRGSTIDLRLELAGKSTYGNPDLSDDEYQPIIARLPHGRGYLAGWTLGNGMLASLNGTLWDDADDARSAAQDEARRACEAEAETRDANSSTAPSVWASYLINEDDSGLDPEDIERAKAWIERLGRGSPVSCYNAGFMWVHDAYLECPLGADCQHYEFID